MTYIINRQKYTRPQAMIWGENNVINAAGNYEVGADNNLAKTFLITSDHNRSEIGVSVERIEKRDRMVNGRMRSFHIADKQSITVSWDMLPSRRFSGDPNFNITTGKSPLTGTDEQYTVDGGAGGDDLLAWYETHTGPFWVYLSYDKPSEFNLDTYTHLNEFLPPIEMYFADFSYTVVQRGQGNHDFWNVSLTLEEA
jgi:hypothetical protein